MSASHYQKGFTLVEMLVYVSLLLIVTIGSVAALLTYSEVIARVQAQSLVTEAGHESVDRISRAILNADSIDGIVSEFGTSTSVLVLNTDAGDTTQFSVASNTLMVEINGGQPTALTSGAVSVDEFWLHQYSNGNTDMVRAEILLSATSSEQNITQRFYGASILRGSYE